MKRPTCRPATLLAWALLAAGLQPSLLQGQERGRDAWQRVPEVMAALSIGAGSRVADVGAGSGYFVTYLAREVGESGRVFAVDISDSAVSQLTRLVADEGLENVEVVRGEVDDPRLAPESLHAVLVVNAYHEMSEHQAMLAGVHAALEPGGLLVLLDLTPPDPSGRRDRQTASHGIGIDTVTGELREAGFEVLRREVEFTMTGRGRTQWLLVARRPGSPAAP